MTHPCLGPMTWSVEIEPSIDGVGPAAASFGVP
jgi:hypothetical protein